MKKILAMLTAFVMMLTCCGALAAGNGETAAAAEQGPLTPEEIQTLNGGKAVAYKEGNSVTFIGGTATASPVLNEEDATRVAERLIPLAGGDDRTRFVPWRTLRDTAGNTYYVFQQVYGDSVVQGGAMKIIVDGNGTMHGMTASIVSELPETEDSEGISAEEAEKIVMQHEAGDDAPSLLAEVTRKIVLPVERELDPEADEIPTRFVWAVCTTNPDTESAMDFPYMAHYVTLDGEYLYNLPTMLPADSAADEGYDAEYFFAHMEPVSYTGYVDWSDGTEKEITVNLMRDTRTGTYYLGNLEHRILVADCWEFLFNHGNVVPESSEDNREWDQVGLMSLYNYCRAFDYFREVGWEGPDGKNTPILVLKDFCDEEHHPVDNAAYAGKIYGWQCFLSSSANDLSQCLDVAAHEFTHGVTDAVVTYNSYTNDFGAINEAMSDIHGNLCEMLAQDTEDESWTLGEHSLEAVRSMSDPHRYSQPEYTWDLYYDDGVKEPTEINDRGGVHTNSSLLNYTAYLLCASGMPLEDARAYWFAADCAMVPGSDYPQLRVLLPWVLHIAGMDRYQEALTGALETTRMGENTVSELTAEEYGRIVLNLPDTEVFNNGKWFLSAVTLNPEGFSELFEQFFSDLENGTTDDYPRSLLNIFSDEDVESEENTDQEDEEAREWLRNQMQDIFFMSDAAAGQDGHTISMTTIPGHLIPVLMYIDVLPNSDQISQMKIVAWTGSRWVDLTALLAFVTGAREVHFRDVVREIFETGLPLDLLHLILTCKKPSDLGDALAFRVQKGETVELPATGLEAVTLESNMHNPDTEQEEVVVYNRKSRPKEE